jgi:hypothetical protein
MRSEPPSGAMGVVTRPWFVLAIVVTCFGILTPKIFMPLLRQTLGLASFVQEQSENQHVRDRFPPPNMRSPRAAPDFHHRAAPHSPQPATTTTPGASSSKSMLNFLLPVYAIGIGLYMFYTLFKVFNSKKQAEDTSLVASIDDSDFDESVKKSSRLKFKEKKFELNPMNVFGADTDKFMFDPENSEFKVKQKFHKDKKSPPVENIKPRSEESEDELNDYARYQHLDPEYVAYLKQRRRMQKREQMLMNNQNVQNKLPNRTDRLGKMADAGAEIPVTPNAGLTSITNTNVLMNETLERMKFSLNKINMQLLETEKKGAALDDPDMEALRLQLAQTEAQMSKIMNIVNVFSDSIEAGERQLAERQRRAELQKQARRIARFDVNADEEDEIDEEEEEALQADADNEEENDEEGNFYQNGYSIGKADQAESYDEEYEEENFEQVKIRYRGSNNAQSVDSFNNTHALNGKHSEEDEDDVENQSEEEVKSQSENKNPAGGKKSANGNSKNEPINIYNNVNAKPAAGKNAARNRKRKNNKKNK